MIKHQVANSGNIGFFAKSPPLIDLAKMISEDLNCENATALNVYVGIHQWRHDKLPRSRVNIGVQTEQYFDQNGKRLWGLRSDFDPHIYVAKFDVVLDLSRFNAKAYERVKGIDKVLFGPYIFPQSERQFKGPESDEIVFIGTNKYRRTSIIAAMKLQTDWNIKVISDQYFDQSRSTIEKCIGLLNVHYQEGVYAEWPRILMAYKSGKPLLSEPLGEPMDEGVHYYGLDQDVSMLDGISVFGRINADIATKYRFIDFLSQAHLVKTVSVWGESKAAFYNMMRSVFRVRDMSSVVNSPQHPAIHR